MKLFRLIATLIMFAAASLAMAGETKLYSEKTFDQLTEAGQSVVLHITAPWCPTCRAQKPIIEKIMHQPGYKDVTLLLVNFDDDKPTLKKFKVVNQSTLVVFKGTKEVGRSVGETDPQALEALIKKSVQ